MSVRNSENFSRNITLRLKRFPVISNGYPDFIIMTKKGHLVAVETKGEQLSNEENFAKARLGHLLDTHDNNDKFSYFMVFEKEKPDRPGCKGWQEFLHLLEKW